MGAFHPRRDVRCGFTDAAARIWDHPDVETVEARVPLRIDLAGGTLDIWPLHLLLPQPAVTVNAAIDLPSLAWVTPAADTGIRLISRDLDKEVAYPDLAALEDALHRKVCPLPLVGEAVLAVRPEEGFTLTTLAESPAGAGLGGSSAMLCVVLGALLESMGRRPEPRALQTLAQDVETRLLEKPTGYQDYFPAIHGGCLALEGAPGGVQVEALTVDLGTLNRRLRLVYTEVPHDSGLTNWGVLRAYLEGVPETVTALTELADISRTMRTKLRDWALDEALALVIADGAVRRRMAPGVTTAGIDALDKAVRAAGAMGTKVMGAGGGGCVLVVLEDETAGPAVDVVVAEGPWSPLPLRLVEHGLEYGAPGA